MDLEKNHWKTPLQILFQCQTTMISVLVITLVVPGSDQNVVSTAQGQLKGETHDGYISYRGIPYASIAKPDGRFKRAGLAPVWGGVREGRPAPCSLVSGEECLQLEVHVPAARGELWPVMVWVAGGAGHYHPETLVRKGIILVIVYHRIGPLGFLCLGEDKIPGNAGVKDLVLALRWVSDNIVAFHGNPAKVVMAGQGLGAAMVEAVMLSPMAVGLYHGVILQSGTVLAPWAFNYDARERAMKLGDMLPNMDRISDVMLKAKVEELVDKSNKLDMPYFPFGMCIETAMKHEERLLAEAPYDLLLNKKMGKVPMIIGYNSDEAYIFLSILKETKVIKSMLRSKAFMLPVELKFLNDREKQQVFRQMEGMYFKENKTLRAVLEFHRDAYFVSHIYRSARLHASAQPVYMYQFSHAGELGVLDEPGLSKTGAAHSDELAYLFNARNLDGDDSTVQAYLAKLWSNFVKFLEPTYKEDAHWDLFDPDRGRVLNIGSELTMVEFPHARAAAAWDDVYHKYYYTRNRVLSK